jgi:hypothetical protein
MAHSSFCTTFSLAMGDVMAQTLRHSGWELGVDFGLGATFNLGMQAVFLRSFSLQRGLGYTSVFLLLALVRRYVMRRGFNRLVQPGRRQSRRMSLLEVLTDTLVAIVITFALMTLWYPTEPLLRIGGLVVSAYLMTPLLRFVLRRFFVRLTEADADW